MNILAIYFLIGVAISLIVFLVLKKIVEEKLKRDIRKFLSEEDFLRTSRMKYTKNYDILIYRILSASVFSAIVSFILAVYSSLSLSLLLVLGMIFFVTSIFLDLSFQFMTLRRVVQGLYDSVWINKIGIPAFTFYFSSSILYVIVIPYIWFLFFHSYFTSVFLFLITISLFSTIYLTLSGHNRVVSYIILVLFTVAIQKAVVETIGYWETPQPFDKIFSVAFVAAAVLIMALVYRFFKESKSVETERYEHLYEPYFVVLVISWIVFVAELFNKEITYHLIQQSTFGTFSFPTIVGVLLMFYGFYPITRFYSTVEKSIKDLKKIMTPKMMLVSSIIPSFVSYLIFLGVLFISRFYGVNNIKWIVNALFTVLAIAFLYEFTILFEVLDDSIENLFRESKSITKLLTEKLRKKYKTIIETLVVALSILFGTALVYYQIDVLAPLLFAVVMIFILHMLLFFLSAFFSVKSELKST